MQDHFRRGLFLGISIIGGSILVFSFGLYILSYDISLQAEKIVADRILISKRAAALGALADLKKSSAQADVYKRAMDKVLVSQDQLLDFPHWLDDLSRVRRVGLIFSFQGNQVQPQGNAPGYISFSLDLTGTLDNLADFIKDVEFRAPRFLVNLSTFDLVRNDGSNYRALSQGKVFFK